MFARRALARSVMARCHLRMSTDFASRSLSTTHKIIYTMTDEAPALATYSLFPVVKTFAEKADVKVEQSDISLSARIVAQVRQAISTFDIVEISLLIF
jgi:monomeric isocitrate dehydrogenase